MEAVKQSLYGINLAPFLFGTFAFVVSFAWLMHKRVRTMHPRQLWILPAFAWIGAIALTATALPQTGTQVVCFVVLAATGLGIGMVLRLSDSLKHDPTADVFTHKNSILSNGVAALIVALLSVDIPASFWPGAIFLSGFVTGQSLCLWRRAEYLRRAPEFSANTEI